MKRLEVLGLNEKKVENVVNELSVLLADLQVFYSNLRGFHWNVKGHGFFVLHSKYEELYNDAAEKVDEVAERILQLGSNPESRFSAYLEVAEIKEAGVVSCSKEAVDLLLDYYKTLIARERRIIDLATEAHDDTTVSLMKTSSFSRRRLFGCSLLLAHRAALSNSSDYNILPRG